MDYNVLAELLFPNIKELPSYYEDKYPKRILKDNEMIARFAPSPTGFVHMGSLYVSFLNRLLVNQFGGIFYLRIEDTDQKREVENGIEKIKEALDYFNIKIDESLFNGGNYGPYLQSERKEIYQTFVKDMIRKGLAYPCFCTPEELEIARDEQEKSKIRPGYYSRWAKCRDLSFDGIKKHIDNNKTFVIRLKTPIAPNEKILCHDLIKGDIEFPVNDLDIVILKSDGLPTYHFAHLVDDYLMGTTHVIRGDEWLSSLPIHLQLFSMLGLKAPSYAHISPLTKKDGNSVRKLSKRKDPECAMSYYQELGIPTDALKLYFATVTNSNFESWYEQNKKANISDFTFSFDKMPIGGTLFDIDKLMNICKTYLSLKTNIELYNEALSYYEVYDKDFYNTLTKDKDYSLKVLNIERDVPRPRMDIGCYKDIKNETWYMFDELFYSNEAYEGDNYDSTILDEYLNYLDLTKDNDTWFNGVKALASKLNYAPDMKSYKQSPESYKGNIGDLCEVIRVALTGRKNSPNLFDIQQVLGFDRIKDRINHFKSFLSKK